MKRYLPIIWFLLTLSSVGSSQSTLPCNKKLEAYLLNMASIQLPQTGNKHLFHFSTNTLYRSNAASGRSSTTLKITIGNNYYHYTSPELSLFADEHHTYIVVHPQKVIIQKKQGIIKNQTNEFNKVAQLQKDLIKQGKVTTCETINSGNQAIMHVALDMNESFETRNHIKQVDYWFDATKDELKKVTIFFNDKSDKVRQEIIYHQVLVNVNDSHSAPARDYIFNATGSLKSQFAHFKYIKG